jgi:hypothetical protein
MGNYRRPPGPVLAVIILFGVFAVLSLVAAGIGVADGGFTDTDIAGVVGALVFGALAWRLWTGNRYAWIFAIVLASLMILAGLLNPTPLAGALFSIGLGAAIVLLLTVPASARAHYHQGKRQPA